MKEQQPNRDEVLATVSDFIREIINEPWVATLEITPETSFSEDLEMESIEFVSLAEKIRNQYGNEAQFIDWLGTMELDEIIGLKVGALVEFIVTCRS